MSTRSRIFLRWLEGALLTAGIACLAWVAVSWMLAARYQSRTKDAILSQLPVGEPAGNIALTPTAPTGLPSDGEAWAAPDERPSEDGNDDALGVLEIPRLQLSVAVLRGDDEWTLQLGAGYLADTPLPWEPGNTVLAGHRDTFFRPLRRLAVGDDVRLATRRGTFHYQVRRIVVVDPDDLWVLNPEDRQVGLTLITCYPFGYIGSAPRRYVVHAARLAAAVNVQSQHER